MALSKNIAIFTLGMLIVAWTGYFIAGLLISEIELWWYPFIPLVFYIMGISLFFFKKKVSDRQKLANWYMLLKLGKLLVSIVVILLAFFSLEKVAARNFIFTFAVYYLLYIIFESATLYWSEKRKKNNEETA
jgi:hypothetical protein